MVARKIKNTTCKRCGSRVELWQGKRKYYTDGGKTNFHKCGTKQNSRSKQNVKVCSQCGMSNGKHSDQCQSCFEYVRHQNLKDGLCKHCRMRTEDPDAYAEARHFGYTSESSSYERDPYDDYDDY